MKDELQQRLEAADAPLTFEPDVEAFMGRIEGALMQLPREIRPIWKRPVAAGVLLAATLTGTALATQASGPGDALFGLKSATEQLWASTTLDDAGEAERHLDVAEERIVQAHVALGTNDKQLASELLTDAKKELASAQAIIDGLENPPRASLTSRADSVNGRIAELEVKLVDDSDKDVDDVDEDERSENKAKSPSPQPSDDPDDDDEPDHYSTPSPSPTNTDEPDEPDEPDSSPTSDRSGEGSDSD